MLGYKKYSLLYSCLFFFACHAYCQEKYQAIKWEVKDGLSHNFSNAVIKDKYGFTWIATRQGIDRFDGIQFRNFNISADQGLIEDSAHRIWVGSSSGLTRIDVMRDTFSPVSSSIQSDSGNHFTTPFWATKNEVYCVENGSKITAYNQQTQTRRIIVDQFQNIQGQDLFRYHYSILDRTGKSVWMLDRGGLTELSLISGKLEYFPSPCTWKNKPGHLHDAPGMCYDAGRNRIWLNTTDGLVSFDPGQKKYHDVPAVTQLLSQYATNVYPGIGIDPKGRIWFALGMQPGIQVFDPETGHVSSAFSNPDLQDKVSADNMVLYCDRDGIVWAGKWSNKGLFQINPLSQAVHRYSSDKNDPHSLSSNVVHTVANSSNGTLWFGTDDGINVFDPWSGLFNVLRKSNIPCLGKNETIAIILDTAIHQAWIIAPFPYRIYALDLRSGHCRNIVWKNMEGQTIELSNYENISAVHFRHGGLISVRGLGSFLVSENESAAKLVVKYKDEMVTAISTDGEHDVFEKIFGASLSRSYRVENGNWKQVSTPFDKLPWYTIYFNQRDQTYWVGGPEFLNHYDREFKLLYSYGQKEGLKSMAVLSILADQSGNIWFNSARGDVLTLEKKTGKLIALSEKDGYTRQQFGFDNPRVQGADGDIYFAGDDGIERISPAKLAKHYPPSYVYFQSLQINDSLYPFLAGIHEASSLTLPYDQNNISLNTGIIDYYAKGKSRIRYKLEGLNNSWQYGSDYSSIKYNALPSNDYKLIVQASNVLDEFNGPEKIITFHILPPFWETWWFRTMALLALLLLLYGIYSWRTANLRRQKRILEQTVKERTAEVVEEKAEVERQSLVIQKEKEKSEELLLNILPAEVAEELKEKGYTTARAFEEATILFSDIKGFTHVAEKMTAKELVKEIDTYFSAFDRIMQQYGLEKIKTIGDAYIAAGGLPEGNTANAGKVIEAAIAMQKVVEQFGKERAAVGNPYFELRIGIHTGPVVAGVVGIKKFQYDIWGDTVNMAARMEQSGVPGRINVSQCTYELIKEKFTCTHRGKVEAKNKGEVDMYFVETAET